MLIYYLTEIAKVIIEKGNKTSNKILHAWPP